MSIRSLILSLYFILSAALTSRCFAGSPRLTLPWHGDNRQKLELFMAEYGKSGPRYDPLKKPVAIFDWDNTVVRNDVGDAVLYWMLGRGLVKTPSDWKRTSPCLTAAAAAALEQNCGTEFPGFLPTGRNPGCADVIVSIYAAGKLPGGTPAWDNSYDAELLNPSYAWGVALMAGYSPAEIRKTAAQAIKSSLGACPT